MDIAEELGDSKGIFFTIFTQLQAWAVGIPILIVVNGTSADGTYLARSLLIWIFACSPLVILIVPKIYRAFDLQRNPERKSHRGSIGIGGPSVRVTGLSGTMSSKKRSSGGSSTGARLDNVEAPIPVVEEQKEEDNA